MTTLLVLLAILAASIGLAVTLRRVYRPVLGVPSGLESEILTPIRSPLEIYHPMKRLLAEEDFAFVSMCAPAMLRGLRRQRRRIFRLYLREMRADFERVYALCRMLAPKSQDPNFASLIAQQALSFYGLLLILHARCTLGGFLHVSVDTKDLVSAFDRLHQAAQAILSGMTPQPALSGSPA